MQFLRRLIARLTDWIWPGPWYPNTFWMLHSIWLARCVYIAAALGIADLIEKQPKTCADLARETNCHEKSLYRVLRALASFKVFREDRAGRFHLTRLSRELLSDTPGSMRYWVIKMGEEGWLATTAALESVKTGESGFRIVHGQSSWEYYTTHAEAGANFIKAMSTFTEWQAKLILAAGDFGRFKKVVDVGGGRGALVIEILKHHPRMRGVVFDLPETVVEAQKLIDAAGLADRCEAVAGSFLESVPAGADLYISKHSLRDWNDENAQRILHSIHAAMDRNATLMVIDAVVLPENGKDRLVKLLDVELMIEEGGGMRTQAEFEAFFANVGLRLVRMTPTEIRDAVIIEAVRNDA